jgi:hypothetical protein
MLNNMSIRTNVTDMLVAGFAMIFGEEDEGFVYLVEGDC